MIIDESGPTGIREQAYRLPSWVENQWVDGRASGPYFPRAFGIHPGPAGAFC